LLRVSREETSQTRCRIGHHSSFRS